jgi:anti-anti-sigma regulatory factor
MAHNFHMFQHKTSESLHIKLTGDFDGSSASELINTLLDNQHRYYQVFINTTDLRHIEPFGLDVLRIGLSEIRDHGPGVIFIGKDIGPSLN